MTTYQWLLFDADNTLFDFDAAEEYALCRTLTHFGVEATDRVKNIYKKGNRALWDNLVHKLVQPDNKAGQPPDLLAGKAYSRHKGLPVQ